MTNVEGKCGPCCSVRCPQRSGRRCTRCGSRWGHRTLQRQPAL